MTSNIDTKAFHIMLVLAAGPLHGYGIRQEVEARTDGSIRLWPATLYGALAELERRGLIAEADAPNGPDDDPRRRYYELTRAGRALLAEEAARLDALAQLARTRLSPEGAS